MSLPADDKSRKALPIFTYITEYFPDALIEECRVAVLGNEQHNPGQPLHWAREKSKDQMNTAFRHLMDHKAGIVKDTDGAYHLAKAIWRLKAELQLTIEKERLPQPDIDSGDTKDFFAGSGDFDPPSYNGMRASDLAEPNFNHTIEMPGIGSGPCRNPRCWCRKPAGTVISTV